jgi:hypothetical protein
VAEVERDTLLAVVQAIKEWRAIWTLEVSGILTEKTDRIQATV